MTDNERSLLLLLANIVWRNHHSWSYARDMVQHIGPLVQQISTEPKSEKDTA